jgi:hypothetical protein
MDWQLIISIVFVALAAAYVLWRAVRRVAGRSTGACSSCHSCPASKTSETLPELPFIAADQLGLYSDGQRSPKQASVQQHPTNETER